MNNRILYANIIILSVMIILGVKLLHLYSLHKDSKRVISKDNKKANKFSDNKKAKLNSDYDFNNNASYGYNRGVIKDRNGNILARDFPVFKLKADRKKLLDYNIASRSLAHIEKTSVYKIKKKYAKREILLTYSKRVERVLRDVLDINYDELQKWRKNDKVDIVVKKSISYEKYINLKKAFLKFKIEGFYFKKILKRIYPYGEAVSQVVGYVDYINDGKSGIESSFNSFLKYSMQDDQIESIFDKNHDKKTIKPELWLTLDMNIQKIAYAAITRAYYQYKADKVIAIFLNPKTGEILAMSNYPSFDPNTKRGIQQNSANLAIQYLYDPGSVFKIVTVAAAFNNERNPVDPYQLIYCHMGKFDNGVVKLTDHHPYYNLNVNEIVQKSSNIGIYMLARQLGKKMIYDYCHTFGFGRKTGIELSSESSGLLKKTNLWSEYSLSRIPIGYEVLTTPLQMAMGMSVIANKGKLMKAKISLKCIDENGKVFKPFLPKVSRYVINSETADKVKKALALVVSEDGTAPLAKIPGYKVAGKTGTSRKIKENRISYYNDKHIVSFAGFLPYENPELLGIIIVDNPKSDNVESYGGAIAAPIFKEIAESAIKVIEVNKVLAIKK